MLAAGSVLAGGCYDCLSAAVLAEAGFACLSVSGAGVAASLLGEPDIGLVTHSEMLGVAGRIARRSPVPVIADIDTGFGGVVNVIRTVEEFAAAGAAAVHIEDQVFPKRCGHLSGKRVVPADEFAEKIRAADSARDGTGMLIIARTDAIAVNGLDDAIERALMALDAGADVAFLEAPTSVAQLESIANRVPGRKAFNLATGGRSPSLSLAQLGELGFGLVISPVIALYPAIAAIREVAAAVLGSGTDEALRGFGLTPMALFELVGIERWAERERAVAP
jgi:2-methylisocitrate lyase-like PEP mutase family enzyme